MPATIRAWLSYTLPCGAREPTFYGSEHGVNSSNAGSRLSPTNVAKAPPNDLPAMQAASAIRSPPPVRAYIAFTEARQFRKSFLSVSALIHLELLLVYARAFQQKKAPQTDASLRGEPTCSARAKAGPHGTRCCRPNDLVAARQRKLRAPRSESLNASNESALNCRLISSWPGLAHSPSAATRHFTQPSTRNTRNLHQGEPPPHAESILDPTIV